MTIRTGKRLDAYFDGKVSPSRLSVVSVIDVCPIKLLSRHYIVMWKKAINRDFNDSILDGCIHYVEGPQRFWDWNCEEFILANIVGDEIGRPIMFAKRGWGGWYGVNFNFMLDVTGKFRKERLATWEKCAKDMGQVMKWNKVTLEYEYFDIKTGKKVEP